jgi:hypothetical protein
VINKAVRIRGHPGRRYLFSSDAKISLTKEQLDNITTCPEANVIAKIS